MAAQHLTALASPEFPQVLNDSVERIIDVVDHVLAANSLNYLLGPCDFEDQYGDCRQRATVHHLESEKEYCCDHFRKVVQRG
jgi:hypothetical protein